MLKISTNTLVPTENMNKPRNAHGLEKMAHKIFAFGGYDRKRVKSAEVYDVVENSWNNLPDMPEAGKGIT